MRHETRRSRQLRFEDLLCTQGVEAKRSFLGQAELLRRESYARLFRVNYPASSSQICLPTVSGGAGRPSA